MKRLSMPRLMLKCVIQGFVASLFCQLLNLGSAYFTTLWWSRLIVLLCDVGLYVSLLYAAIWKHGDKDRNLANFGHIAPDPNRGFVAALPVAGFYFLLSVIMVLAKLSVLPAQILVWFRLLCPQLLQLYNMQIPALPTEYTTTPFTDLTAVSWPLLSVCCLLSILLPLLTYGIGFRFGYRGIQLGDRLVYKKKID